MPLRPFPQGSGFLKGLWASWVELVSEISRWANRTLFGGQDETVSSRLGKLEREGGFGSSRLNAHPRRGYDLLEN